MSCTQASEARCSELSTELNVTRDELVRTSAVAARVAASEAKAGLKAEGTVSLGQHVEEVKHLNGLIGQLKERLALAERDLSVAHNIKVCRHDCFGCAACLSVVHNSKIQVGCMQA